jgi:hypothetical protein
MSNFDTFIAIVVTISCVAAALALSAQSRQYDRLQAAIAAINEDLVAMDADLEEVFDFCFPEGEVEPATIVGKSIFDVMMTRSSPIYVESGEEIFDFEEVTDASDGSSNQG